MSREYKPTSNQYNEEQKEGAKSRAMSQIQSMYQTDVTSATLFFFLSYVRRLSMYLKLICTLISSAQQYKTALASFIYSNDKFHLLIKNDRGNLTLNVGKRFKVAELSSVRVTLDNDNTAVALHADGNLGAGLVDGELAREAATGGNILEKSELSCVGVDGEVDDGIRVNRLGLVVKAGDVIDVFAAG